MNNKIAVIGDSMIDEYMYCERIKDNPEHMHGSVLRTIRKEFIPGGAAAVAILSKSLGADVDLFSISGSDEYGNKLSHLLGRYRVNSQVRHSMYKTTVKTRYVVDGELHKDRFDEEEYQELYTSMAERWLGQLQKYRFILISDYGKGVISDFLLNNLPNDKVILVDPATSRKWTDYYKADIIKANRNEANIALQATKTHCILKDIATTLSNIYERTVIVTVGPIGLYYAYHNQVPTMKERLNGFIPSIETEVKDICGAGDTIFAAIGTLLAEGFDLRTCCTEAVKYASQQIQSIGIRPLEYKSLAPKENSNEQRATA